MRALILFALLPYVLATSFYIQPFSQFTESTSNIIYGTIHNVRTEEGVTEGGKTIYTFADVEIKDVIKGSITSTGIMIRKLGGSKEGQILDIPGSPEFTENEEAVLFLDQIPNTQFYEITGMEQGKFGLKEENDRKILTGGIFALSAEESTDQNISENLKTWSLLELKNLVQKQNKKNKAQQSTDGTSQNTDNILTKSPDDHENHNDETTTNERSNQPVNNKNRALITFTLLLGSIFAGLYLMIRIRNHKAKK